MGKNRLAERFRPRRGITLDPEAIEAGIDVEIDELEHAQIQAAIDAAERDIKAIRADRGRK